MPSIQTCTLLPPGSCPACPSWSISQCTSPVAPPNPTIPPYGTCARVVWHGDHQLLSFLCLPPRSMSGVPLDPDLPLLPPLHAPPGSCLACPSWSAKRISAGATCPSTNATKRRRRCSCRCPRASRGTRHDHEHELKAKATRHQITLGLCVFVCSEEQHAVCVLYGANGGARTRMKRVLPKLLRRVQYV